MVDNSRNLFNDLLEEIHRFDPPSTVAGGSFRKSRDLFGPFHGPEVQAIKCEASIRCETKGGAPFSIVDPDNPRQVLDYFLLTHEITVTPTPLEKLEHEAFQERNPPTIDVPLLRLGDIC
jgi:hypothetical protein